jgi:hypothetical protein
MSDEPDKRIRVVLDEAVGDLFERDEFNLWVSPSYPGEQYSWDELNATGTIGRWEGEFPEDGQGRTLVEVEQFTWKADN